jgi:hypothetical protein
VCPRTRGPADGAQVVAGDRLGLRAAVLAARQRVDDDVRRLNVEVGGRGHASRLSVRFAGASEVGCFLEPRRDREQRAGLLGEQARQRPLERDERRRACSSVPAASSSATALCANSRSTVRSHASAARARPARSTASRW